MEERGRRVATGSLFYYSTGEKPKAVPALTLSVLSPYRDCSIFSGLGSVQSLGFEGADN